jgi:polo-like kinase 1
LAWVSKWLDFTFKYGLGFQLSNGLIGVNFNDNTKIISSGIDSQVKYIFKPPNQRDNESKEIVVIYDLKAFPQEMKKKITLFKHFKKYFASNSVENAEAAKKEAAEYFAKQGSDFLDKSVEFIDKDGDDVIKSEK